MKISLSILALSLSLQSFAHAAATPAPSTCTDQDLYTKIETILKSELSGPALNFQIVDGSLHVTSYMDPNVVKTAVPTVIAVFKASAKDLDGSQDPAVSWAAQIHVNSDCSIKIEQVGNLGNLDQ